MSHAICWVSFLNPTDQIYAELENRNLKSEIRNKGRPIYNFNYLKIKCMKNSPLRGLIDKAFCFAIK